MLILASDTSGASVSTALWQSGQLLGELTLNNGLTHSVSYLPLVQQLLRQCGKVIHDVDVFAVTVGPGSFTGIRIGISAVKAMAYAAGKLTVGVSSLEAMAWPFRACRDLLVCPMLDARNDRVFAGAWLNGRQVLPEANQLQAIFLTAAAGLIGAESRISGLLTLGCPLPSAEWSPGIDRATFGQAPRSFWLPRASSVGEMAELACAQGLATDPQILQANYLAIPAAERLKAKTHG